MTKILIDEATVKLALEALEEPHPGIRTNFTDSVKYREKVKQAITALRKALANEALERMAENARELGLDYEPATEESSAVQPAPAQPNERDIRNATLDEIASKIALMPFGDTAASFAVWIREQKQ